MSNKRLYSELEEGEITESQLNDKNTETDTLLTPREKVKPIYNIILEKNMTNLSSIRENIIQILYDTMCSICGKLDPLILKFFKLYDTEIDSVEYLGVLIEAVKCKSLLCINVFNLIITFNKNANRNSFYFDMIKYSIVGLQIDIENEKINSTKQISYSSTPYQQDVHQQVVHQQDVHQQDVHQQVDRQQVVRQQVDEQEHKTEEKSKTQVIYKIPSLKDLNFKHLVHSQSDIKLVCEKLTVIAYELYKDDYESTPKSFKILIQDFSCAYAIKNTYNPAFHPCGNPTCPRNHKWSIKNQIIPSTFWYVRTNPNNTKVISYLPDKTFVAYI
jgi:hypothetical protein